MLVTSGSSATASTVPIAIKALITALIAMPARRGLCTDDLRSALVCALDHPMTTG
jgi:hypothetical protein